MQEHVIVVVAFDRIIPFHLSVPCLVFGETCPEMAPFDLRVCAAEAALRTTAGFTIAVELGLDAIASADTVIVPSWRHPDERPPQALLDALVAAHARGARWSACAWAPMCWPKPACSMAAAPPPTGPGPATSPSATRRCIWTRTCSTSKTANCSPRPAPPPASMLPAPAAPALRRRDRQPRGPAPGGAAASPGRPSAVHRTTLPTSPRDDRLTCVLDWVRSNLEQEHSLDSLAQRVLMSRRTFSRHFRQLTGSPSASGCWPNAWP